MYVIFISFGSNLLLHVAQFSGMAFIIICTHEQTSIFTVFLQHHLSGEKIAKDCLIENRTQNGFRSNIYVATVPLEADQTLRTDINGFHMGTAVKESGFKESTCDIYIGRSTKSQSQGSVAFHL
jgi:hypothetical protein